MLKKGDIITLDLGDGYGNRKYRILKIDGPIAEVLGLFDLNYGQVIPYTKDVSHTITTGNITFQNYNNNEIDQFINNEWYNDHLSNKAKSAIQPQLFNQDVWYFTINGYLHNGSPKYNGVYSNGSYQISNAGIFSTIGPKYIRIPGVQDILDYFADKNLRVDPEGIFSSKNIWKMFWDQDKGNSEMMWLSSSSANDSTKVGFIDGSTGLVSMQGTATYIGTVHPIFTIDLTQFLPLEFKQYISPYTNTVILQDDALNLLMRMTKCYPIAGDGTGITLVPTPDDQHIQIQNAIKIYSVLSDGTAEEKEKHPGCICIWDTSASKNNKQYIQAGSLLDFYTSELSSGLKGKDIKANQYGSFILIKNKDYKNPIVVPIKGFDSQGNLILPGKKIQSAIIESTGAITATGNITSSAIITGKKVRGAVFNDYAEYRESYIKEPGRCVIETGYGDLELSTKRLQLGGNIISDTFGFSIGETDKAQTPIAVCGRVLAYPDENKELYKPGAAVCSGPNGTVSLMTREEIKEWPDAIIGYVSEIPYYDTWGTDNIKINNRIWIKIK